MFFKCGLSADCPQELSRSFGGGRRVVPPAGEPRVRTPELIDSASLELGCPRLVSACWGDEGLFLETWLRKDAEGFLFAAVTLGSPSGNTTPRCQLVARGWVLPLPNPQSAALGAVGRGGLAGTRRRLQSQQHFSDSTKFSGSPEAGPSSPLPIRWHLAPQNWPTQQSRSFRPARTARQYPMLDALYISNATALNVFIVGVDNVLRLHR